MKFNRKVFYVISFLLCLFAACQKGKVSFTVPAQVDFGQIAIGDSVLKDIYIINNGSQILEIKQIKGSCSCMVLTYPKIINIKDSGSISVKLRGSTLGVVHQLIMLETNSNPVLRTIKISGYVHQ